LVDPSPVAREEIGILIGRQPDLEVVVQAGTADEALTNLKRLRRRGDLVALVALEVDGQHDGYWLIHELREQFPQIRIVASAGSSDRMAVSRALFVGADGFIHKRANPLEFLDSLRRAGAGEMVLAGVPREWLGPIPGDVERQGEPAGTLTAREREVLAVAAEGLTARGIATRLGLSERTVTTHLANIYSKLGVNSRVAAVTTAVRMGLVMVGSPWGLHRDVREQHESGRTDGKNPRLVGRERDPTGSDRGRRARRPHDVLLKHDGGGEARPRH